MQPKRRSARTRITRAILKLGGALLALLLLALVALRVAAAVREEPVPPPAEIELVSTRLGEIAVQIAGPVGGPPILLLHGTAAWSGFWREPAAHLSRNGWRVIAVDLPPFGWSARDPQKRYDRITQADRLAALLQALRVPPAVIVGHSFGGGPAVELALRHPKQVRSLVLVAPALGPLDPPSGPGAPARLLGIAPLAEGVAAATMTNPVATGPLLRSMIARKAAADRWLPVLQAPMRREGTTRAYAAWLPNLLVRDDGAASRRSDGLRSIKRPVTLIWGDADTVTPLDQGRRIAALTRARSLTILPGVGHIPHIEDPQGFLAALDAATAPDREGEINAP